MCATVTGLWCVKYKSFYTLYAIYTDLHYVPTTDITRTPNASHPTDTSLSYYITHMYARVHTNTGVCGSVCVCVCLYTEYLWTIASVKWTMEVLSKLKYIYITGKSWNRSNLRNSRSKRKNCSRYLDKSHALNFSQANLVGINIIWAKPATIH